METRHILRRGLQKFFDLHLEFLELKGKKFDSSYVKTNKFIRNLKKITIDPVKASFESSPNMMVKIYNLNKANGENAQVSYCAELNLWSISSKNVSLVAGKIEDLISYTESRFDFAKLIANEWFRIIAA